MKKTVFVFLLIAVLTGCNQSANKADNSATTTPAEDATLVSVYYFHGKQRCKTCIAVGNIAQETVEKAYADNSKVVFTEIKTDEKANIGLVEKYQVTWNALIIAKGEDFIDLTEQAFAIALSSPDALTNLINEEVNKRL
ncbi:nitrophenyl compound nitroreductase subunit ArsF family protein [Seramator thermalis]|uniref:nitrophenyl compound nitroreductase subunit ArsF family protein n=1 Tax=Seramator thermalis TaxID=2496270 RepID=UPI00101C305B|nr:nitrophenyl compound nitroreductase subunit ArsF family protein [Seramator thermalis]